MLVSWHEKSAVINMNPELLRQKSSGKHFLKISIQKGWPAGMSRPYIKLAAEYGNVKETGTSYWY